MSVIVYLNSIPPEMGGGTKFYTSEVLSNLKQMGDGQWSSDNQAFVIGEVEARAGRMLIFDQTLAHEGVQCIPPYAKYIIRTDIMFERTPKICNSSSDITAYNYFREAEALAERGEVDLAIPLFKKAFKLSPQMAIMMGQ
jgi:hypothetical protein